MTHHILTWAADHDPRVPSFLNGSLTPVKVRRHEDVTRETLAPYWSAAENRYIIQGSLWFISRERRISVDYYPSLDGFLASDKLIRILRQFSPDGLRVHPVEVIDEKGNPNADHPLWFCQLADRQPACDLAAMDVDGTYHPEIDSPNQTTQRDGQMVIKSALAVAIKSGLPDLFLATDFRGGLVLVSAELCNALKQDDIIGARLVPLPDICVVDFMPHGPDQYTQFQPQWRLRSDLAAWRKTNGLPVRADFFDPAKPDPAIAAMIAAALKGVKT